MFWRVEVVCGVCHGGPQHRSPSIVVVVRGRGRGSWSWIDFKNFLARLATRLVPFRKVIVPFRKFVLERPPVTRDGHISKVGRRCRAWRLPTYRWVVPSPVPARSPSVPRQSATPMGPVRQSDTGVRQSGPSDSQGPLRSDPESSD